MSALTAHIPSSIEQKPPATRSRSPCREFEPLGPRVAKLQFAVGGEANTRQAHPGQSTFYSTWHDSQPAKTADDASKLLNYTRLTQSCP